MTVFASLLAIAVAAPLPPADAAPPPVSEGVGEIVVSASRSGEGVEVRDLPASVTVLTDEELARRQTRIVSDVLRDVPGLAVSRGGGIGGLTQVRVRGTESNHVLVLIDGIEASDPFQGEFDFGSLIADEAARIEILRGQQSSLYGSDAIGGVIHYITLTGSEAPGLSLRAEGGSFGTFSGGARAAGVSGTLDYAVSGSVYTTEGTPTARFGTRDIGATIASGTAKLSWAPSPAFRLTGVGRWSHTEADSNDSEWDPTSPLFGYTVDSPGVGLRNQALYGLVRGELTLGRWTGALTGQIADFDREGFGPSGITSGDEGRRYKGSFETGLRFGGGRLTGRLTGAVDFEREEFRNTTPFAFQGRRATENWGFVGQGEVVVDDSLSIGASIRRDENDRFDDVTTWRAQAGYRLPFGLRLRGAYGTGVKNPGYFELFGYSDGRYIGNPNLRPEKSEGWEIGLDQELADGLGTVGATWFDSTLEDEIFITYPAPDFLATPANRTTRSRQKGVELFASARPVEGLRFSLAYTYLDAEENGVREIRRPRHVGSVNTTVLSRDGRFAGTLTVRYNGRQDDFAYTDPSYVPVRVSLQEYVLVNLNAEYRLSDALSLHGRLENLFDEDYEEVFSFATPGRAAYAGLKARF